MDNRSSQKGLIQFRPGQVIFEEGSRGDFMYVITSGSVEILKSLGGSNNRINLLERGDFFGEMALLQDDVRTATAKAVTNVGLLKVEKKDFQSLMQSDIEIPIRIMRRMANSLLNAEARLAGAPPPTSKQPAPDASMSATKKISVPALAEFSLEGGKLQWPVTRRLSIVGRKDNVTGISPDVDLAEADPEYSVSRFHARLMGEPSGYRLIEEVGAKNGTAINGHRLIPGVAFAVKHGDHVQVGLVGLRFADLSGA